MIQNEWVDCLEDLVERRLMLLYEPNLSSESLRQLASCLVDAGRLAADEIEPAVERARTRLLEHYGKKVID